jgi:hypothetical protein
LSIPHLIDERLEGSYFSLAPNEDGRTDRLVGHDRHDVSEPFHKEVKAYDRWIPHYITTNSLNAINIGCEMVPLTEEG